MVLHADGGCRLELVDDAEHVDYFHPLLFDADLQLPVRQLHHNDIRVGLDLTDVPALAHLHHLRRVLLLVLVVVQAVEVVRLHQLLPHEVVVLPGMQQSLTRNHEVAP